MNDKANMMTIHRIWHQSTRRALRQVGSVFLAAMFMASQALGQAALLPPAKQQFLDNNGNPLNAGKVYHYIPNTSTLKNTWTNSTESSLNTNPVILDAGGRAIIFGAGTYRQVLQDSSSVEIYDALTAASGVSTTDLVSFIATTTSGGSANAQTITATTPSGFALTNGYALTFTPGFTNTGAATLNVAGTGIRNISRPSFSGPVALTGGEIRTNQVVQVVYDGAQYILNTNLPYFGASTNISSATTTDLGTVASHVMQVTGTVTITSFGSSASVNFPIYLLRFSGILTLTYNGASLILPGAANITTANGDAAIVQYLGSGNWQVIQYQRAAATPFVSTLPTVQRFTATGAATYTPATGVVRAKVRIVGAGGGGGARITNAGSGGGTTNYGSWTAIGGSGGTQGGGATAPGGAGGTGGATGTGTLVARFSGGGGNASSASLASGAGAPSPFGGAGSAANTNSNAGVPNTGSGGSGGSGAASGTTNGGGGGAGEYVEFWVNGPVAIGITVGAGGAGGAAGTTAGANGGDAIIIVEEFYN